jgi:hypothetical protein
VPNSRLMPSSRNDRNTVYFPTLAPTCWSQRWNA